MKREIAIRKLKKLKEEWVDFSENAEALDMAIEALKNKNEWIPVKWHEITEEERKCEEYPKHWKIYLDCEMPEDDEEILVTTKYGVGADVNYKDYEYYLESGLDWADDIIAWRHFPEPYKEESEDKE